MKQFYIFIFVGMFQAVMRLIDTSFGNNMGKDAIVVLSGYMVLSWLFFVIYDIGIKAYDVFMKYESECLFLVIAVSSISGVALICCSDLVAGLYYLTDAQHIQLRLSLIVFGLFMPFEAVSDYLDELMALNSYNKQLFICNAIYYVLMIAMDALVFFTGGEVYLLFVSTGVCCIIYDILVVISCKLKFSLRLDFKKVVELFKHGFNIASTSIVKQLMVSLFNIQVSKLGTDMMAIHGICYDLAVKTEVITGSIYTFQVYKMNKIKNIVKKYSMCKCISRLVFLQSVIFGYLMALIMLIILRGSFSYFELLPYVCLYCVQVITFQSYENHRAFLTSCQDTKSIGVCNIVGSITRFITMLFIPYLQLIICALAPSIDICSRGLYLKYKSKKLLSKGGYING